jgi:hypothetical protein
MHRKETKGFESGKTELIILKLKRRIL